MNDWVFNHDVSYTYPTVLGSLQHQSLWSKFGNPSARPSALSDWGFWNMDTGSQTAMADALVNGELLWPEVALLTLVKRVPGVGDAPIRPFVAIAKVMSKLYHDSPDKAFFDKQSFSHLLELNDYDEITDQFCSQIHDPAVPAPKSNADCIDFLLKALDETGLFRARGAFGKEHELYDDPIIVKFIDFVAKNGESMSQCQPKSVDATGYYQYMGSLETGLPEILGKLDKTVVDSLFPHYDKIKVIKNVAQETFKSGTTLVEINKSCNEAGLVYDSALIGRFISGLMAKPFVVLTGLSGSGKTKLAQAVTSWMGFGLASSHYNIPIGTVIENGAYKVVDADKLCYSVFVDESKRVRMISKAAVDIWVQYFMGHPQDINKTGGQLGDIVKATVTQEGADDNYMISGSSAVLAYMARYVINNGMQRKLNNYWNSIVVPVGADWTNSEKLLGYPNALDKSEYVMPDTGVLKLVMDAEKNPTLPFFLILDEMNLSHVERYFADFLSAMESGDEIKLYDGDQRYGDKEKTIAVPRRIRVPKNLFVIGTMNVDETTYMFSPKVLDRAQVIEFRVKDNEMAKFVGCWQDASGNIVAEGTVGAQWKMSSTKIDLSKLADANGIGKGAKYAESFLKLALERGEKKPTAAQDPNHEIPKALNGFFKPLAELGAEFGYRSAAEIMSFCGYYLDTGATIDDAIDAAIVQKLLPKLHGSRRKLEQVLPQIWTLCRKTGVNDELDVIAKAKTPYDFAANMKYVLSAEKVLRMFKSAVANGFASFAEA